jgi:hypothetical protein
MRAKPDLIPDCDIHGEPMYRDECPARALGLTGGRDLIVWRCCRHGCGRYFLGTVGYAHATPLACPVVPTPRCEREGAFLIVQRTLGAYICLVDGCSKTCVWQTVDENRQLRATAGARSAP